MIPLCIVVVSPHRISFLPRNSYKKINDEYYAFSFTQFSCVTIFLTNAYRSQDDYTYVANHSLITIFKYVTNASHDIVRKLKLNVALTKYNQRLHFKNDYSILQKSIKINNFSKGPNGSYYELNEKRILESVNKQLGQIYKYKNLVGKVAGMHKCM